MGGGKKTLPPVASPTSSQIQQHDDSFTRNERAVVIGKRQFFPQKRGLTIREPEWITLPPGSFPRGKPQLQVLSPWFTSLDPRMAADVPLPDIQAPLRNSGGQIITLVRAPPQQAAITSSPEKQRQGMAPHEQHRQESHTDNRDPHNRDRKSTDDKHTTTTTTKQHNNNKKGRHGNHDQYSEPEQRYSQSENNNKEQAPGNDHHNHDDDDDHGSVNKPLAAAADEHMSSSRTHDHTNADDAAPEDNSNTNSSLNRSFEAPHTNDSTIYADDDVSAIFENSSSELLGLATEESFNEADLFNNLSREDDASEQDSYIYSDDDEEMTIGSYNLMNIAGQDRARGNNDAAQQQQQRGTNDSTHNDKVQGDDPYASHEDERSHADKPPHVRDDQNTTHKTAEKLETYAHKDEHTHEYDSTQAHVPVSNNSSTDKLGSASLSSLFDHESSLQQFLDFRSEDKKRRMLQLEEVPARTRSMFIELFHPRTPEPMDAMRNGRLGGGKAKSTDNVSMRV
jgi:hypothetical protein